jgi:hypothetical protein
MKSESKVNALEACLEHTAYVTVFTALTRKIALQTQFRHLRRDLANITYPKYMMPEVKLNIMSSKCSLELTIAQHQAYQRRPHSRFSQIDRPPQR